MPEAVERCHHQVMAPRVVIVDDHDAFRAVARAVLEADGFEVVGEAAGGLQGVAEVARTRPEVVLLDILLPDVDGFEVAGRLAAGAAGMPPPVVVLVSSRDAAAYARRLATAGVRGFLTKSELTGAAVAKLLEGHTS
jgi:DNA-binding NarL/FixJ family response regulator